MSDIIRTINIQEGYALNNRDISLNGDYVHSIDVDQTSGDFVATMPIKLSGMVIFYPQNPSRPEFSVAGEIKEFTQFYGYGLLNFPLDSKIDYVRKTMWIADTGNNRILRVSLNAFTVTMAINNVILPYAISVNINDGSIFVQRFVGLNEAELRHYDVGGNLIATFLYEEQFPSGSLDVVLTDDFCKLLPLVGAIKFDHVRSRVWWTAKSSIHMVDLYNVEHVVQNLSSEYQASGGLDIDFSTGYAFVAMKNNDGYWQLLQVFRDNNMIVDIGYIPYEVE